MTLKSFLKSFKTNESTISMVLGALVVVVVGVLVVNYFKDRGQTLPDGLKTTGPAKEHVVVKGESLWSIAEDSYGSGYKWTELAKANNLTNYSLEVGQKLSVPDKSVIEPTGQPIDSTSYTVTKGDSLWKIAVRAYGDGYAWTRIAAANNLKNPGIIHAGNVLTIPR